MVTCEVEMVPHVYFAHCLLLSFLHHFYVGLLLPSLILIAERCAAAASFLCARILPRTPGSGRGLTGTADCVRPWLRRRGLWPVSANGPSSLTPSTGPGRGILNSYDYF